MKKLFTLLSVAFTILVFGQNPGDTIVVHPFNYNMTYGQVWDGTIRDTTVTFPDNQSLTFERVMMLYNIRCKDALVSTGANTNLGCGEWDYSCNTYIHDSTQVDSVLNFHPSHGISGFSGSTYYYKTTPVYDYLRTIQSSVSVGGTPTETSVMVGSGSASLSHTLPTDKNSSKAQYLFTAAELTGAGFATGTIDALGLNVLSGSEDANFLRVRIKHTTASTLDPTNPDLTGFDEVYYHNKSFAPGANKIQFHTPFNWDGTSNVIIEFTFTNSVGGTAVMVEGGTTADSTGMYNNNANYISVNGGGFIDLPTTNMNSISNEITVSFWSRGGDALPVNTSILEAADAGNNRQVNIHHPWSNGRIYWDCGGDGSGGYDRIDKAASATEYEGNWHHWAFTKNATTGDMKIYLDGVLWHSGTGKTNPIDIQSFKLAANRTEGNKWYGYISELRIFDVEVGAADIMNWMNSRIDNSHPNYANLVAYYPLDEGTGTSVNDPIGTNNPAFDGSINWGFTRGDLIENLFTVVNERPNIDFFQGTYSLTVVNDTILDSTQHEPNVVLEYAVNSNAGTAMDDDIITVSTNTYWEALTSRTYNESGQQVGASPNPEDGQIDITELQYFRRFPMRFEIMSLVTPYGINLNMGPDGETFIFDVSDFMPMLTGDKRITVERGGQWQEDMDIKFLFIVGTPPRDVMDIRQIWRNDSKGYSDILAERAFEPRDYTLDANGEAFKIRSTISGHGQEGEFIPRTHYLNIDGGANEYTWQVWKECSENPIYPQGGTWIYDRAGWCPGMATDTYEADITQWVTAGNTHNIDYGLLGASGTSNYIVNNQLVTYGAPNHTLDAQIVDVVNPSNYVEYKRDHPMCGNPKVRIRNTGSTALTSLTIEFWVNNDQNHQTYQWTGNLDFLEEEIVELPNTGDLWLGINGQTDSKFNVIISDPNGGTDEYSHNNQTSSDFTIPDVLPSNIYFDVTTNSAGSETSYELFDDQGNVLLSRSGLASNTNYRDTFNLAIGCYKLVFTDSDDDGISFWANSDGSGIARIRQVQGPTLKYIDGDFGGEYTYYFTVDSPLSYDEWQTMKGIKLFPNPTADQFTIEGNKMDEADIQIFNAMGQSIQIPFTTEKDKVQFSGGNLTPGLYLIKIKIDDREFTERLMIE